MIKSMTGFGRSERVTKERKIAIEMERFYQLAKQLLIDNKELLQLVADSLLEKKTLTYNDIKKLVG